MPCDTAQELFLRGNAQFGASDFHGAAESYRRALELAPEFAAASFNLGCCMDRVAGPAQALPHFVKAAALRPEWCEARCSLGFALARTGSMAEAAAELAVAAALKPDEAGIRNDLGLALSELGRGEEAFANFSEAIRLNPLNPEFHNNLAVLFERFGRTSEAISSCREALRLRPEYPEAHSNLASALKSQGRHAEAISHYREALRLKPDFASARSSLLFSLCYPADIAEDQLYAEHVAFGSAHKFPIAPHGNDPSPERPLRIGYVSADFRAHAVARFIEPVLRHHDRSRFSIFCYSNVSVPDERSATLAGLCDRFVNIAGVQDEAAAQMIREDGIDILVDLSGHTGDNRLLLFARKPAPVQVTWLGYPHTTGLAAIDYRITDSVCDPPGEADRLHSEKLLRLPGNFSCFAPDEGAPEVGPLPCPAAGSITFGSFNNPAKITSDTVALWASALHAVPRSRMLVKGYSLADRGTRERLASLFAAQRIAPERLELVGNTPSYLDHLGLYRRVDIALDTYPYHGTTTTCEALWMGVPVVTLAGRAHRSRVGASILASVGLQDLVAKEAQGYAQVAAGLARDTERLERLRKGLRQRMAESRLTDGAGFTVQLEQAYREIWRTWCGGQGGEADRHGGPSVKGDGAQLAVTRTVCGEGVDHAALGRKHLQEGKLDRAVKEFLFALKADGDRSALGGIEQALKRQTSLDLAEALNRDAGRNGFSPVLAMAERIHDDTVEEAAEVLLALGLVTPAELVCGYLADRGVRRQSILRIHAEAALSLGATALAAAAFRNAASAGDHSIGTRIKLLKAEESARLQTKASAKTRYLLIKAWGYGFWSDVNHVLGQLLVAELTGRVPVVHWGGNSLFSDDPAGNAFENFFEPVSDVTLCDLARTAQSFYPPKWNAANVDEATLHQADGPWSRCSSLYALNRDEDVVVSDFHFAVNDLLPWIPSDHHLQGKTTDEICLYLCRRYLKVKPALEARAGEFFQQRMAGAPHLALHVRGGDKGGEDPNLARLNLLYHPEIARYLQHRPEARLFLLTDDRAILSEYLERYGDRVVHTGATRTESGKGVHYQQQAIRRRLGEEVIIDALLALRCDAFIGNGLSNVSCAIAQMKAWAPGTLTLLGARLDRLRQITLYRS